MAKYLGLDFTLELEGFSRQGDSPSEEEGCLVSSGNKERAAGRSLATDVVLRRAPSVRVWC